MLQRTTGTMGIAAGALWQRKMLEWMTQWEWAEDLPPQQCVTRLELMIVFELEQEAHVPAVCHLAKPGVQELSARAGIGQEASRFRHAWKELLKSHFTVDSQRLFCKRGTTPKHAPRG